MGIVSQASLDWFNTKPTKSYGQAIDSIRALPGVIFTTRLHWVNKVGDKGSKMYPLLARQVFGDLSRDSSWYVYNILDLEGYHDTFMLITKENKMHFGWTPSHCDQFAEDWIILSLDDLEYLVKLNNSFTGA